MNKLISVLEKKIFLNKQLSKKEIDYFNYQIKNINKANLETLNTLYKLNIYLNSKKKFSNFKKNNKKIFVHAEKKIKNFTIKK